VLLAQTSLERMTSVGRQHTQRIYVFTRIFAGANPFISVTAIQLTPKPYYNTIKPVLVLGYREENYTACR